MTRYLIIDDEPIAHRIIEGYCEDLPHLEKVGNAYNAFEASELAAKQRVDLLFLDLNLPKLTGFEWLRTLPNPPKIIVTTAYQEFALEGYELNVVDYLLKPFSFARFLQAVNKVIESAPVAKLAASEPSSGELFPERGQAKAPGPLRGGPLCRSSGELLQGVFWKRKSSLPTKRFRP